MSLRITPVNEDKQESGTWVNYRGVDLLIARSNNDKFGRAFRRLMKPYKKDFEKDRLDIEVSQKILASALAEGVLLGWKNFVVEGKEVQYSKENAIELLIVDRDCRDFVSDFANDLENFLSIEEEATKEK